LASGWATLLSGLPLGQAYFQSPSYIRKGLISQNTDYLPGVIQAAPAVGTIETIVYLATFAGCETVDVVDGYPIARGEGLQLSFRDHPILGAVAILQQFPSDGAYST
jgi:hypothetical protein